MVQALLAAPAVRDVVAVPEQEAVVRAQGAAALALSAAPVARAGDVAAVREPGAVVAQVGDVAVAAAREVLVAVQEEAALLQELAAARGAVEAVGKLAAFAESLEPYNG